MLSFWVTIILVLHVLQLNLLIYLCRLSLALHGAPELILCPKLCSCLFKAPLHQSPLSSDRINFQKPAEVQHIWINQQTKHQSFLTKRITGFDPYKHRVARCFQQAYPDSNLILHTNSGLQYQHSYCNKEIQHWRNLPSFIVVKLGMQHSNSVNKALCLCLEEPFKLRADRLK